MKKLAKWQWGLIIVGLIVIFSTMTGPKRTMDTSKTPEIAKVVENVKDVSDVVPTFSFKFPDANASVVMKCVTPDSPDGFSWDVVSLDGTNPPKATKIYFNLAKSKSDPIVESNWRGIISQGDKMPIGDAFMLTAFQMNDQIKNIYKYYVFGLGESLEDVRNSGQVVYVPIDLVTMTAALTMNSHPCSTMLK